VSDLQSQNEAQIRKGVEQVQEIARDNLIDVYDIFIDSLQESKPQKKSDCLIQ
jgi:uncharacterized protein YutE (UPF0331/DUF86 family)